MPDRLFSRLTLTDVHRDVVRNIVSIRASQDLFDDLAEHPEDQALAQQVEHDVKPASWQSATPIIHRPFEDAHWFNAIAWPFRHWQASRYSDGSFGVWYGCGSVATSVHETVFHWFNGLLRDAGFERQSVIGERKIYNVACDAALVDLRPLVATHRKLIHRSDYGYTQSIGSRLHHEGHPGLISESARHLNGHNYVVLNPDVLSNPRFDCQLTYRLDGARIVIEKQPGVQWMEIATESL